MGRWGDLDVNCHGGRPTWSYWSTGFWIKKDQDGGLELCHIGSSAQDSSHPELMRLDKPKTSILGNGILVWESQGVHLSNLNSSGPMLKNLLREQHMDIECTYPPLYTRLFNIKGLKIKHNAHKASGTQKHILPFSMINMLIHSDHTH